MDHLPTRKSFIEWCSHCYLCAVPVKVCSLHKGYIFFERDVNRILKRVYNLYTCLWLYWSLCYVVSEKFFEEQNTVLQIHCKDRIMNLLDLLDTHIIQNTIGANPDFVTGTDKFLLKIPISLFIGSRNRPRASCPEVVLWNGCTIRPTSQ